MKRKEKRSPNIKLLSSQSEKSEENFVIGVSDALKKLHTGEKKNKINKLTKDGILLKKQTERVSL